MPTSKYSFKKLLKMSCEALYVLGNGLMLYLILYGVFFADANSSTVIGFVLLPFIPLYVLSILVSPILIGRDYVLLKSGNYFEHPIVLLRFLLYICALVSIPLFAVASYFI